jgi:hypothetical protein
VGARPSRAEVTQVFVLSAALTAAELSVYFV